MKKKFKFFSALILSTVIFAGTVSAQKSVIDKITFVQDGKKVPAAKTVLLKNKSFEIHFADASPDDYISIFATTDFNYNYEEPTKSKSIDVNDTVMFNPGTYIIKEKINPRDGSSIYISDSYGFNGFSSEQRINSKNEAVVYIVSLNDTSGNFLDTADFYFYVDYDNDNLIDENEFAKIKISFEGDGDLYANKKAYVSTMGYSNYMIQSLPNDGKFHLYVIDSYEGAKRFCAINDDAYGFDGSPIDFKTQRLYILLSPVTDSLHLMQPYTLTGTKKLIFETEEKKAKTYYVSVREYKVEKDKDIFTIYVKTDEGLVQPVIHKMD